MSTLTDIRKAAESPVRTTSDDNTPAGHFLANAKILGIITTYLLAGGTDDPEVVVVGRVEHSTARMFAYRGANLKGGTLIPARYEGEAFRAMV